MMTRDLLQKLTIGLSIGTTIFGVAPMFFPRKFAEIFGLPATDNPASDIAFSSVGARDAINGIGIFSATIHGGRVAPWLLARAVADGTDALAIGLAWRAGARNSRLLLLGALALGATVVDIVLYRAHRGSVATESGPSLDSTGAANT